MNTERETVHDCGCHDTHHEPERRFCINTEDHEHPWDRPTITTEEIAKLGGWAVGQGVIEVHEDNTERTLKPGEVVHLKPGHAFCRRVRWKRGFTRTERVGAEINLLRRVFPKLEVNGTWVRIPGVPLPPGWNRTETDVAFQIADAFPGSPPYGIFVPVGLRHNGQMPQNYTEPSGNPPPFAGTWAVFSWSVFEAADWQPCASVEHGANLLQWVRGFAQRFAEGA